MKRKYIGIDQSEDAIKLSKQRLENPIKTESNLLKKGKAAYVNQDPKVLEILNYLNIVPVQRNKGIDGFLKTDKTFKPIPVKIQKENETLENAIQSLQQACKKNSYQWKILIKANNAIQNDIKLFTFMDLNIDNNTIIIDDLNKFHEEKEKILTY